MSTTAVSEYTSATAAANAHSYRADCACRNLEKATERIKFLEKDAKQFDQRVRGLKQDAEKRRIYNDAVFKDWIEHKIAAIANFDDEDSITLTLPRHIGDLSAESDYPDYIHFLKGMEKEGEGSEDVFSVKEDEWFVKSVESEVFELFKNGKDTPCTHFKVTVEKVITYECMCCSDFRIRDGMMTNGDDYLCEDCHSGFMTMD